MTEAPKQSIKIAIQRPASTPTIFLSASFTEPSWKPVELEAKPVKLTEGFSESPSEGYEFSKTFELAEGKYEYRFRLGSEENWFCDEAVPTKTDSDGNMKNILLVKDPSGLKKEEPQNEESKPETRVVTPTAIASIPAKVADEKPANSKETPSTKAEADTSLKAPKTVNATEAKSVPIMKSDHKPEGHGANGTPVTPEKSKEPEKVSGVGKGTGSGKGEPAIEESLPKTENASEAPLATEPTHAASEETKIVEPNMLEVDSGSASEPLAESKPVELKSSKVVGSKADPQPGQAESVKPAAELVSSKVVAEAGSKSNDSSEEQKAEPKSDISMFSGASKTSTSSALESKTSLAEPVEAKREPSDLPISEPEEAKEAASDKDTKPIDSKVESSAPKISLNPAAAEFTPKTPVSKSAEDIELASSDQATEIPVPEQTIADGKSLQVANEKTENDQEVDIDPASKTKDNTKPIEAEPPSVPETKKADSQVEQPHLDRPLDISPETFGTADKKEKATVTNDVPQTKLAELKPIGEKSCPVAVTEPAPSRDGEPKSTAKGHSMDQETTEEVTEKLANAPLTSAVDEHIKDKEPTSSSDDLTEPPVKSEETPVSAVEVKHVQAQEVEDSLSNNVDSKEAQVDKDALQEPMGAGASEDTIAPVKVSGSPTSVATLDGKNNKFTGKPDAPLEPSGTEKKDGEEVKKELPGDEKVSGHAAETPGANDVIPSTETFLADRAEPQSEEQNADTEQDQKVATVTKGAKEHEHVPEHLEEGAAAKEPSFKKEQAIEAPTESIQGSSDAKLNEPKAKASPKETVDQGNDIKSKHTILETTDKALSSEDKAAANLASDNQVVLEDPAAQQQLEASAKAEADTQNNTIKAATSDEPSKPEISAPLSPQITAKGEPESITEAEPQINSKNVDAAVLITEKPPTDAHPDAVIESGHVPIPVNELATGKKDAEDDAQPSAEVAVEGESKEAGQNLDVVNAEADKPADPLESDVPKSDVSITSPKREADSDSGAIIRDEVVPAVEKSTDTKVSESDSKMPKDAADQTPEIDSKETVPEPASEAHVASQEIREAVPAGEPVFEPKPKCAVSPEVVEDASMTDRTVVTGPSKLAVEAECKRKPAVEPEIKKDKPVVQDKLVSETPSKSSKLLSKTPLPVPVFIPRLPPNAAPYQLGQPDFLKNEASKNTLPPTSETAVKDDVAQSNSAVDSTPIAEETSSGTQKPARNLVGNDLPTQPTASGPSENGMPSMGERPSQVPETAARAMPPSEPQGTLQITEPAETADADMEHVDEPAAKSADLANAQNGPPSVSNDAAKDTEAPADESAANSTPPPAAETVEEPQRPATATQSATSLTTYKKESFFKALWRAVFLNFFGGFFGAFRRRGRAQ